MGSAAPRVYYRPCRGILWFRVRLGGLSIYICIHAAHLPPSPLRQHWPPPFTIDMCSTSALALLYISLRFIAKFPRPKLWPQYRHAPDLGFSPALHAYTIHREISSSSLIVENSWPNFRLSIDVHCLSPALRVYSIHRNQFTTKAPL